MEMVKDYLLQNWPLILILAAFIISLINTVSLDKKRVLRLYVLIATVFILSIIVFVEFYIIDNPDLKVLRLILMSIRYSATPLILAQVMHSLVKRMTWVVFMPAAASAVINVISIFTGIVFYINDANEFHRGPLGFLPFIMVGLYGVVLVYLLVRHSNKRLIEIVSIAFLAVALGSGLILPFIFHGDYASMFCITIAVALFSYYEFSIIELTKKDPLTGLLNRQAYYLDIEKDSKNITALISIDMNGLKAINDNEGHAAGDEALVTIAMCFTKSLKLKQSAYRTGGDEFIILCRKSFKNDVLQLVERINKYVAQTKYTCSIGYSFNFDGDKTIDQMATESDAMMYENKDKYYLESGLDRRKI